jgi:deoxyuridine 5'-triphosphate nucleotidohydrolase
MCSINVLKLHPDARLPDKDAPSSAGFNLYSIEEEIIEPHLWESIRTGISIRLKPRICGIIRSIYILSLINGIEVGPGIIDSSYIGEIKILIYNHSSVTFLCKKGLKIAQIVFVPVPSITLSFINEHVEENDIKGIE